MLLQDVPGIGAWRLESHGFYAAVELAGMVNIFEEIARRGGLYPAALRIDNRQVTRSEGTRKFAVPVLDIAAKVSDLFPVEAPISPLSASERPAQLPAPPENGGHTPLERVEHETSFEEAVAQTQQLANSSSTSSRANAAEPIRTPPSKRRTGSLPTPPDEGEEEPGEETPATADTAPSGGGQSQEPIPATLTDRQRRFLHARKRELGLSDEEVKDIIEGLTGQRSTTSIPAAGLDEVLARMESKAIRKSADEAESDQITLS